MKPRRVPLDDARRARDVIDAIVRTRRAETEALSAAFASNQMHELHDFRIACKRLRYAMERFSKRVPEFEAPAASLAAIQDALGEAHDRDVLLAILPPTMPETERALQEQREELVRRAADIWASLPP
ncbi:MAG TPA: CHAD domain-containing protein [Candidatus Baltobacteraceae bacterium]